MTYESSIPPVQVPVEKLVSTIRTVAVHTIRDFLKYARAGVLD